MMSVYTGLYVQKDSQGKIHTVQVYDTAGNSIPLDTKIYIERNIKPNISSLPTKEEFDKGTHNANNANFLYHFQR